jgi:hypothetical protein
LALGCYTSPATAGVPAMVITPSGCIGDLITVGGKAQPVLLDFQSQEVTAVIDRLIAAH